MLNEDYFEVKKKYDPALYLVLALLFAASVFGAAYPGRGKERLAVEAVRNGEVIALGFFSEITEQPGEVDKINGSTMTFGEPGNFNEIIIGDAVRMVSADCPGGDCLRTGGIKKTGEMIVCVPNRLIIRLVSSQRPDVDAVSH